MIARGCAGLRKPSLLKSNRLHRSQLCPPGPPFRKPLQCRRGFGEEPVGPLWDSGRALRSEIAPAAERFQRGIGRPTNCTVRQERSEPPSRISARLQERGTATRRCPASARGWAGRSRNRRCARGVSTRGASGRRRIPAPAFGGEIARVDGCFPDPVDVAGD